MLVASPRFAALLADFTGWRPFAVEVFDKRGEPVQGYVGVSITGRCGPIRCDVSRTTGSGPLRSYIGLLFDRPTWDGTDLFVPPNMGLILMSPRLAKAVRRAKIGNVQVEALSDFEMMAFLVHGTIGLWLVVSGSCGPCGARVTSVDIAPLRDHRARAGSVDGRPELLCHPPGR